MEKKQGKPRVHDDIVERLAESIFSGAVKPGQTLPSEMTLCQQFGVSRTAIREAIRVLSAKGLVQARSRSGTTVLAPSNWNFMDAGVIDWMQKSYKGADFFRSLIEVRLLIEPSVAVLAAERATAQEVANLEQAYNTMVSAEPGDFEACSQASLDFHIGVITASHNLVLRHFVSAIRVALLASFRMTFRANLSWNRTIEHHRQVVEAIRLRQAEGARKAMLALLNTSRDELLADPEPRRWPTRSSNTPCFPAGLAGEHRPPVSLDGLVAQFRNLFGEVPQIYRAPGRLNLIGEHTDYNDGFVLPVALDLSTWVAISPRTDRRVCIHTDVLSEAIEFDLDEPDPERRQDWSDYVRGVALMLERTGHWLKGANLLLKSDVSVGAGLGSSAALEASVGYALVRNSGRTIDPIELARCCQRAENEFVGMRCGIMDQFISCHGAVDHAVLLDCRSLESRLVPIDPRARLVICNTMVRHELAGSEYNLRRQDCERGVALLSQALGQITALRDVTAPQLDRYAGLLPEVTYRRCRHVVSENDRVLRAAAALENGELHLFGKLLGESHRSLRNDFQVSCLELDLMVELALSVDGVYGSRMTGGGFGGCTINLVEVGAVERFSETVSKAYQEATGLTPSIFSCLPGAAVGAETLLKTAAVR
ncbi:galactokinase [Telmatospirillum sp.]|uniref:galactokinase n=1 Tax=Telmatospirillum sp. TaxID=2079197 RepID=UPI00284C040E|nr:galactokinase [Telmatospirillum sp.]MDR3438257.1 galactokinase [Telmatospirillum sp.]